MPTNPTPTKDLSATTVALLAPIVGAYHRPPAKQTLAVLPAGSQLELVPEPENPYDSKAIQVRVRLYEVMPIGQVGALAQALEGTGYEVNELCSASADALQLGYIADSDGKALAKLAVATPGLSGNREVGVVLAEAPVVLATLAFAATGQPLVRVIASEGSVQDDEAMDQIQDESDE